jgi:hypothetical protein
MVDDAAPQKLRGIYLGWRVWRWLALGGRRTHILGMNEFDRTDYSVVVKLRANPPNPWRWEIYRAGKSTAIMKSLVHYPSMAAAHKAGKTALTQLLQKVCA